MKFSKKFLANIQMNRLNFVELWITFVRVLALLNFGICIDKPKRGIVFFKHISRLFLFVFLSLLL